MCIQNIGRREKKKKERFVLKDFNSKFVLINCALIDINCILSLQKNLKSYLAI